MKTLKLADLENLTDEDLVSHIASNYSNYGNSEEQSVINATLKDYDILVAYESTGDWGCDSSSFFLLKNKKSGKYHEVHGGHCSCYGFEGQFEIEKESPLEYLKSDKFYFSTGGYDGSSDKNQIFVKEYIQSL